MPLHIRCRYMYKIFKQVKMDIIITDETWFVHLLAAFLPLFWSCLPLDHTTPLNLVLI